MKMYQRRLRGYVASGYEVPSMTDLLVASRAALSFPQSVASTAGETGLSDVRGAVGSSEELVPYHVPTP